MRKAHPVLNLTSSNHHTNSFASLTSPGSLAPPTSIPSSIPTICSLPVTPDTARQLRSPEYIAFLDSDDSKQDGRLRGPLRKVAPTNFLSALTEATGNDRESMYSQDSACVVFTPKVYSADAPPKSALTFAAVWDPENGMSTFTGTRLLDVGSDSRSRDSVGSETIRPDREHSEYYSFISDLDFHGHPDCEPHLPSRFSTTTTSTSNYIDVDFNSDSNVNVSSNSMQPQLQPGDIHPAWVPQIFTLGYTKPPTPKKSKRPEISEPFQLTSSLLTKRPTISRINTNSTSSAAPSPPPSPSRRSGSSPSSSNGHGSPSRIQTRGIIPPFTRSQTYSSCSSSTIKAEPGPLRRGFSFGNGNGSSNPSPSPSFYETTTTEYESPHGHSRPTTPSSRPRFTSVLGKMKPSQKRHAPEDGWVMVDVTSVIRQRLVREGR